MNIASWPNSVICKTWPMVTWLASEILFLMKFWQTIQPCSAKAADAHSQLPVSGTDGRLHKQSEVEWRQLGDEIPLPLRFCV